MSSFFPRALLSSLSLALLASSCSTFQTPVPPQPDFDFPRRSEAPITTVHLMMVTPEALPAFLAAKEDVARPLTGRWRAGDGTLSLQLLAVNGQTMPSVECGGVLFVPGINGSVCRLRLHNHRNVPVEAVISAHHADLFDGGDPSTIKPGMRLDPHRTRTIKAQLHANSGESIPLIFRPVATTDGLFRYDLAAQQGVIRVAVHAAPEGALPLRQPIFPSPGAPPRYEPHPRTALPYEYR